MRLLNSLDPLDRIDIVSELYMSNLITESINEFGENVLKFKDLAVGDKFILFPKPGDDHGHGGLKGKGGCYIFEKIPGTPDEDYYYGEKDNARRLIDGNISTFTPHLPVIKVL